MGGGVLRVPQACEPNHSSHDSSQLHPDLGTLKLALPELNGLSLCHYLVIGSSFFFFLDLGLPTCMYDGGVVGV